MDYLDLQVENGMQRSPRTDTSGKRPALHPAFLYFPNFDILYSSKEFHENEFTYKINRPTICLSLFREVDRKALMLDTFTRTTSKCRCWLGMQTMSSYRIGLFMVTVGHLHWQRLPPRKVDELWPRPFITHWWSLNQITAFINGPALMTIAYNAC